MGRAIETRFYEDSTNYIASQTQYDALGRAFKASNPFRPLSETAVWTTQAFDALGRVTSVTTPDTAVVMTSYSGTSVTATDQTGKQRQSVTDALGFDATNHRFWRIRYDQTANLIYFETSANDSVWTIRKTVTPGFSLSGLRIHLLAGCYGTGNSSPGTVKYDNVKLLASTAGSTSLTVANAGFEAPVVGNGSFQYSPSGGSWTFANGGGISGMNSGFTGIPSAAPEGVQVAFIQATGEISQSISGFQANTNYVISFAAIQRTNCCNAGGAGYSGLFGLHFARHFSSQRHSLCRILNSSFHHYCRRSHGQVCRS